VGSVSATQQMRLSIILPPRNHSTLTNFLSRLYDPTSPDYHHFLNVDQFTEQFGPTQQDYQAVVDFAKSNGFAVSSAPLNRMVVSMSGSASQVERAFNVRMNIYRHPKENRNFYSPDREPSLDLRVPVAHIAGLNNFSVPRPMVKKLSAERTSTNSSAVGSGPGGSYLASDMRAAYYGGTAFTGSGQTVGLMQFDGYNISDVTGAFAGTATATTNGTGYILSYTPTAGGPTYHVPVNNVLLDGVNGTPTSAEDAEEVLDIVQAVGMAPGLSQVRVYIGSSDVDILNKIADENVAKQISISWGWYPDDPYFDDFIFQELAAQGQSVFVASGDSGAYDPSDIYFFPAEDDFVTAVGGTDLTTNGAGGPWNSETSWSRSGGGPSMDFYPIPNWQAGVVNPNNQGSTLYRNSPDVSMEADFDNYNCNMGTCQGGWGGTSFASPRWAGYMAMVNQQAVALGNQPVGFLNPLVYAIGNSASYTDDFHDISTGNNGYMPGFVFYAGPGYDLVTGWGSPNGTALMNDLTPQVPVGFRMSAASTSLKIVPGNSATTTISIQQIGGFSGSVTLSIPALPSGLTASFDTNPATTASKLTISADAATPRGSFLLLVTGSASGTTVSISIAIQINAPGFGVNPESGLVVSYPGFAESTFLAVNDLDGFTGPISYDVTSALPEGVTTLVRTSSTFNQSIMTFITDPDAQTTNTSVSIAATSGNISAESSVHLAVDRPIFYMGINPMQATIAPGSSFSSTVYVAPVGDFTGSIQLSSGQLPTGVTVSFDPAFIGPGETSTVTVTASADAPAGAFYLTIWGDSNTSLGEGQNSGVGSAFGYTLTVTSTPPANCAITLNPPIFNVTQGGSATSQILITDENGFDGAASLPTSGFLPSDSTLVYAKNPTHDSSSWTITAKSDAYPTQIYINPAATCGSEQAPIFGYLEVTPTLQFDLGTPTSLAFQVGKSTSTDISIADQNGFVGNVTLSAIGLPSGITASFSSNPTSSGSTLTLNADASLPPGNYFVNIAATNGVQTLTRTVNLQIQFASLTPSVALSTSAASLDPLQGLSATVTVSSGNGNPTPTGTLTLTSGYYTSTATTLVNGSASFSIPAGSLAVGTDTLTAIYTPDSLSYSTYNNATGTSTVTVETITPTITVTPSSLSITALQGITVAISVNGGNGNQTPSGSVIIGSGSYVSTATSLVNGGATINIPAAVLQLGSDILTVTFLPGPYSVAIYSNATGTSPPITVTRVNPTVTVTPSSSSISTVQGLAVAVALTGNPTPTGSVTLSSGSYTSAGSTLSSGSSTINIPAGSLATGTDTLTVSYTPDSISSSIYNGASGTNSVTVAKTPTTVTVTPSAFSISTTQALTVMVGLSGGSGNPTPTGSVTLTSGSYSAQQTINSGASTFAIAEGTLSNGVNTLTASYSGDLTYTAVSSTATVTVEAVSISTKAPSPVSPGSSTTSTIALTGSTGYSGTLNLSCSLISPPAGAQSLPTCVLRPASVILASDGAGTSTLVVNTTAGSTIALARPSGEHLWRLGGGGTVLAAFLLFGIPFHRRRWISMLALLLFVATAGTIGCGGYGSASGTGGGSRTPATTVGNYSFTVIATDSFNPNITASTTLSVNVQ
jgi:hypothetical protein